jgi:hypothetical protein
MTARVIEGTRRPRTMRETEIWHQAQADRDERQTRRIAGAERGPKQVARPEPGP